MIQKIKIGILNCRTSLQKSHKGLIFDAWIFRSDPVLVNFIETRSEVVAASFLSLLLEKKFELTQVSARYRFW